MCRSVLSGVLSVGTQGGPTDRLAVADKKNEVFLIAAADPTDISIWKEYGFPGLVCASLLALIFFGFRTWMAERKDSAKAYKEATDEYRKDVKEITSQQSASQKEVAEKMVSIQKEQTAAFRELHEKTMQFVTRDRGK